MARPWLFGLLSLALFVGCFTSREDSDDRPPADAAAPRDAGPPDLGRCTHPDEITVSCEPAPMSEEGCTGGEVSPSFGMVPGDPDAVYPVGCEVTFPFCLDAYPNQTAQCTCERRSGRAANWWCPV